MNNAINYDEKNMKDFFAKFPFNSEFEHGISEREVLQYLSVIESHKNPMDITPADVLPYLETDLSNVQFAVFDIYGTLLHSAAGDIHTESDANHPDFNIPELELSIPYKYISEKIVTYVKSQHAHMNIEQNIAHPEIDSIEMWKSISKSNDFPIPPLNNLDAGLAAIYYEIYNNPSTLMPLALETLQQIKKAGITLGIVSNAQFYTPLFLHAHCASSSSRSIWHETEIPIQLWSYQQQIAKPSPILFSKLQEQINSFASKAIAPENILYVGNDMRNDIAPPSSLGMRTVLFAGDSRSYRPRENDATLKKINPDARITRLDQLISLLRI